MQGSYDKSTNTIGVNAAIFIANFKGQPMESVIGQTNNLRGLRRLIIHEIQHFVQNEEGFAYNQEKLFQIVLVKRVACF